MCVPSMCARGVFFPLTCHLKTWLPSLHPFLLGLEDISTAKRISQIIVESTPLLCQGLQFVLQRKARSAGPNLVDLELSVGSCLRKISQVSFPNLLKLHKGAQSLVGPASFILKGYHPADHDEHEAEELGIVTSCLSFVKSCSRMKHSCHQSDLAASISALGPDEAFCPCC